VNLKIVDDLLADAERQQASARELFLRTEGAVLALRKVKELAEAAAAAETLTGGGPSDMWEDFPAVVPTPDPDGAFRDDLEAAGFEIVGDIIPHTLGVDRDGNPYTRSN
jgi:hypothetical protein